MLGGVEDLMDVSGVNERVGWQGLEAGPGRCLDYVSSSSPPGMRKVHSRSHNLLPHHLGGTCQAGVRRPMSMNVLAKL